MILKAPLPSGSFERGFYHAANHAGRLSPPDNSHNPWSSRGGVGDGILSAAIPCGDGPLKAPTLRTSDILPPEAEALTIRGPWWRGGNYPGLPTENPAEPESLCGYPTTTETAFEIQSPPTEGSVLVAAAPAAISVSSGGSSAITLEAGQIGAGDVYLVLLSLSGSSPGIPFGGEILPLNPDALTNLGLALANSPLFANFAGLLSPSGSGSASVNVPPGLAAPLVGATVTAAAVVLGSPYGDFPSENAASIQLVP